MHLNHYYDAAHGWIGVPEAIAHRVELSEGDFSPFSYKRDNVLYLEEDLDATVFLAAWEAQFGPLEIHGVDHGDSSPIRQYDRVVPNEDENEFWF